MKDFLQRHVTVISSLLAATFSIVFLLFMLMLASREQRDQFERIDQSLVGAAGLPGPQNQISERSRKEIDVLLRGNKRIVGGYVAKIHYGKTENPVIYFFSKDPLMNQFMRNYDLMQKSGRGYSSAELDAASAQSAANTEEAKTGVIRCVSIHTTNIHNLAKGIDEKAKGVCRATIPPFDENVNLSLVVLIDNDASDQESEEIIDIRRTLLQLQIDIFNRDFQGRETWAHP